MRGAENSCEFVLFPSPSPAENLIQNIVSDTGRGQFGLGFWGYWEFGPIFWLNPGIGNGGSGIGNWEIGKSPTQGSRLGIGKLGKANSKPQCWSQTPILAPTSNIWIWFDQWSLELRVPESVQPSSVSGLQGSDLCKCHQCQASGSGLLICVIVVIVRFLGADLCNSGQVQATGFLCLYVLPKKIMHPEEEIVVEHLFSSRCMVVANSCSSSVPLHGVSFKSIEICYIKLHLRQPLSNDSVDSSNRF